MTKMQANRCAVAVLGVLTFLAFTPAFALAHESHVYEINGVPYEFVVGSRGEPVMVDDKTGVEFELVRAGTMVPGAQNSLKVEIGAGGAKKTEALEPVYGSEGKYKTNFFPTVATTLTYRFFGELEGTPVDLTFTCNPVGHPQSEASTERVEVSPGVVRTSKIGAFGCPQPKDDFGFPEKTTSVAALSERIDTLEASLKASEANRAQGGTSNYLGIGLGVFGVLLGGLALVMARRKGGSADPV